MWWLEIYAYFAPCHAGHFHSWRIESVFGCYDCAWFICKLTTCTYKRTGREFEFMTYNIICHHQLLGYSFKEGCLFKSQERLLCESSSIMSVMAYRKYQNVYEGLQCSYVVIMSSYIHKRWYVILLPRWEYPNSILGLVRFYLFQNPKFGSYLSIIDTTLQWMNTI